MKTSFKNKSAFITGGASGIGRAIATEMIKDGANILIADIVGTAKAAKEIGCAGTKLDVTNRQAVSACIEQFAEEQGQLDYIFNNAGVVVIGKAKDMSYDDWSSVLDVNIRGVVNGICAAYPIMIRQSSGHIVNTASVAGLIPTPGAVPYCASKHAVVGMSTSLRAEARAHNINVSAICPGFIRTPMADNGKMISGIDRGETLDKVKLAGGWITPEQMASAALKGVRRNDSIIIAPRRAGVLAQTIRSFPKAGERFSNFLAGMVG